MFDQRVNKVREKLLEKNLDAILISNFYNILYLTGFKTLTTDEREAFVLVTKNKTYLFSDERYLDKNYQLRITNYELKLIEPGKGLIFHLQEIVKAEQLKNMGFEAEDLKYLEFEKIKEFLSQVNLVPTDRLIVTIREIKDQEEINLVEKACEIGDQCLRDILKIIKLGVTEKEIAFKLEMWIKEKGYDLSFDPIIAVDANSAIAHYNSKTGNGVVKDGSVILLDFGVKYNDYLSDMTRMVYFGKPNEEVHQVYKVLKVAQEKTLEKIKDFEYLKDIDGLCRKMISDQRLPNYPHSTGHGVGLEIHEYPKVSLNSPDRKLANQIITIEPGVYFPGKFGMRVEDTVVVDDKLQAKTLTKFSKNLLIC
ncbi:hypothetical protein A2954_06145 [Candidatus Roizmanbacteria bacterium RIFCSPLOWO2_01_FULL_37_12]|uniref:Xaa-Pro dipeptidase n=1 Tax=Candidatus Roizmanbacteria bacterium RIFCSPLOWO2_01_FULL_37_12 TaxID=1802056 RepID=A0A1F7ICJ4_9BACT|nr:MAG: hypothetical protein A2768_01305 [Candidatus Roizmanbacteria bacterium RIFCSPHIGHO2_01_FULL_37_16]OGK24376.1 MAG: hypothetical protein A3D76_01795 [Candidatus Roizmanbacteria bacterium RIFCSPHIGHO2_02_FULL_37_9b]OGK41085.1 MAG: hypothetical protein A2954_06145 [Candidatus Roizmanbacteria bacterium RIFCSPLOWO2_01_FULL_37_12]